MSYVRTLKIQWRRSTQTAPDTTSDREYGRYPGWNKSSLPGPRGQAGPRKPRPAVAGNRTGCRMRGKRTSSLPVQWEQALGFLSALQPFRHHTPSTESKVMLANAVPFSLHFSTVLVIHYFLIFSSRRKHSQRMKK